MFLISPVSSSSEEFFDERDPAMESLIRRISPATKRMSSLFFEKKTRETAIYFSTPTDFMPVYIETLLSTYTTSLSGFVAPKAFAAIKTEHCLALPPDGHINIALSPYDSMLRCLPSLSKIKMVFSFFMTLYRFFFVSPEMKLKEMDLLPVSKKIDSISLVEFLMFRNGMTLASGSL